MRDCRTFLRLQDAMELSKGAHRGNITQGNVTIGQGYQVQNDVGYLGSKVYISAMIQPVPKSKKEQKSISRQVNLAISHHHQPLQNIYDGPTKRSGSAEQTTQGKYIGQDTRQWC
jgi:hypothetical protein